jgi:hypothetical protein
MLKHWFAGEVMQHLRPIGLHASALSGCENNDTQGHTVQIPYFKSGLIVI